MQICTDVERHAMPLLLPSDPPAHLLTRPLFHPFHPSTPSTRPSVHAAHCACRFTLEPPDDGIACLSPKHSPTTSRYTVDVPAHSRAITLHPVPLDDGASIATPPSQLTVAELAPGTSKAVVLHILAADGINSGTISVLIAKAEPKIRAVATSAASQLCDPLTLSLLAHPTRLTVTAAAAAAAAIGRAHERIDRSAVFSVASARYVKSIPCFSPRICSRTLMGYSDPSVFSSGRQPATPIYADGRSSDDVIAF